MKLICPTFPRPNLMVAVLIIIFRDHKAMSNNGIDIHQGDEWLCICFVYIANFPVGGEN